MREAGIEVLSATVTLNQGAHEPLDSPELAYLSGFLYIALGEISLNKKCIAESERQLERGHHDNAIVRKLDEINDIDAPLRLENRCWPARALCQWRQHRA